MLRRDTEYVLTWNAQEHTWLARPIERDGNNIVNIARGGAHVDEPALALSAFAGGRED